MLGADIDVLLPENIAGLSEFEPVKLAESSRKSGSSGFSEDIMAVEATSGCATSPDRDVPSHPPDTVEATSVHASRRRLRSSSPLSTRKKRKTRIKTEQPTATDISPSVFLDLSPSLLRRTTALDALWSQCISSCVIMRKSDVPLLSTLSPEPAKESPSYTPIPEPDIPGPLKTFLDTLKIPLTRIACIFVDNGFDSDATLDLLCESPPEGNCLNTI
jgi:hypothetical protein